MRWDAVVIGSGIGGLACAGTLAAKGRKVLVLEQGAAPGGYLSSFRRGEFVFDAAVDCVSGLDRDGILTWLLSSLGVDSRLERIRIDPVRMSRFPGLSVRVDAELPAYVERLSRLFPGERKGIEAFFRRAGEIYADVEELMRMARGDGQDVSHIPSAFLRYRDASYADLLALDIKDRKLAAVLSDRCPFLGLSPRRVSAIRMVSLVMSYFRSGAFRPTGGHQRLSDLLVEGIREKGGTFLPRKAAGRILVERGRCVGVAAEDGEEYPAAHVVSNADPCQTFRMLPAGGDGGGPGPVCDGRKPSPSFFIVYAGVRGDVPMEDPASSTGSFDGYDLDALLDGYVPFRDSESLGLTIPTLEDPSLAPAGHHVLLIHELIPHGFAVDWRAGKEALTAKVLRKAERIAPGLTGRLAHIEAATPATLARFTRNRGGAAFGWEQVPDIPRVRHGIGNLHLAGHWTETGGGVLAAAYSGVRAAAKVVEAGG